MPNPMIDMYAAQKAEQIRANPQPELAMQQGLAERQAAAEKRLFDQMNLKWLEQQRTGQRTMLPSQEEEYGRLREKFNSGMIEMAPREQQMIAEQQLANAGIGTKEVTTTDPQGNRTTKTEFTSEDGNKVTIEKKTPYEEQLEQMMTYQPQVNLQPLAQLVDTWTGSNFAPGMQDPNQQQMAMMKQKLAVAREQEMYPLEREMMKSKIRQAKTPQAKPPKQKDFLTRLNSYSKDLDLPFNDIVVGLQKRKDETITNPIVREIKRGRGAGDTNRLVNLLVMRKINLYRGQGWSEDQIERTLPDIHNSVIYDLKREAGIK